MATIFWRGEILAGAEAQAQRSGQEAPMRRTSEMKTARAGVTGPVGCGAKDAGGRTSRGQRSTRQGRAVVPSGGTWLTDITPMCPHQCTATGRCHSWGSVTPCLVPCRGSQINALKCHSRNYVHPESSKSHSHAGVQEAVTKSQLTHTGHGTQSPPPSRALSNATW